MDPIPTPKSFPFPYDEPYPIQKDFMKSLFRCLDNGKLGIFESPTGTGKSLSLICGTLLWFKQREEARKKYLKNKIEEKSDVNSDGEEDWFSVALRNRAKNEEKLEYKLELKFLEEKQQRLEEIRQKSKLKKDVQFHHYYEKKGSSMSDINENEDEDHDLVLNDYSSGEEDGGEENYPPEDQVDYSQRIYYCSRTHSQLSQFVKEVKKSPYADSIRLISLGSRKNACINDSVRKLKHNASMNEKCIDLQKGLQKTQVDKDKRASKKKKTTNGCPFYSQIRIEALKNMALTQISDIEDLVSKGKKTQTCPYYSSRHASEDAELVVIPYNTLLHKSTREACGIKLKNSVLIIDEAHNLLETIAHIHSCEIKGSHLKDIKFQLQGYLEKFRTRLKPRNILYIKQLIFIVTNFIKVITSSQILTTMAFLQDSQIFNIDLFKILRYILKSKLSYKLRGFSQKYSNEAQKPSNTQTFLNSMKKNYKEESPAQGVRPETESDHSDGPSQINILFSFISNLVEDLDDGRVVITHSNDFSGSSIKFILLNPTNHFKDLVKECHSIIVAGGTMEPVDEFKKRLFISSGATKERIHHFSCGHIIPESNILPIVLHRGPSGKLLDFSFSLRDLKETYEEILRILSNLVTIIPGGIVVFFPSYHYETKVHAFLSKSSTWNNLVAKKKKLYREPKNSDAVEEVLKAYSNSVQNSDGAILFSVVGGKMSEGINFSDDMGRCVLMIGLPFSNSKSPELKEKMEYLNRTEGSNAGNSYYENSCMKAVNQSIGRAIRHGNDYATIILADHRYSRGNIHELLPGWIRDKVWNSDKFGPVVPRIRQFFKSKSV